ncbi:MAG: dihydroorotate dehydrogenase electron transfer subunit [Eubacterium sp.]|nr:dihydroorotate dehydrogenase electron transfer subunit [Eubacterium sp.]
MSKFISNYIISETERLAPDVFSMTIEAPDIADEARAGQFVSLYLNDSSHILPRPISICEINKPSDELPGEKPAKNIKSTGTIRLVYRIAGYGTEVFSHMAPGSFIRTMGPLGNGFPVEDNINKKNVILIGGGIGIPPMLAVARQIRDTEDQDNKHRIITSVGYRDRHIFLSDELSELSDNLLTATDDGSVGTHGNVIDALNGALKGENEPDRGDSVIYACGPIPMLRGVRDWGEKHGIPTWISMEERMACGIGACLGCVCKTKETDGHSLVKNARVCADGPVFRAEDIEL